MNRDRFLDLLLGVCIGLLIASLIVTPMLSSCRNFLDGCFETVEEVKENWRETLDLAEECLDLLEYYRQTPGTPATDSW